jgi:4-hydroxythreonine-4-phosphate dehydrogenase
MGITMGDNAGIGTELVLKAASNNTFTGDFRTVIIGDERQLLRGMRDFDLPLTYRRVGTVDEAMKLDRIVLVDTKSLDADAFLYGCEDPVLGLDAGNNIKRCVEACKSGCFDAICFAPSNKAALKRAGFKIHGQIDLLAELFEFKGYYSELSVLGNIWSSRVTSHIPHREVGAALTVEGVYQSAQLLDRSMRDAGFKHPRIAIAGLNPHNGESGTCGMEEIEVIEPAVKRGIANGLNLFGPLSADTLFFHLFRGDYDGMVGMYHDQVQIALKLGGFDKGITISGGLPYPATTCAHGTAFDIAGKGVADSGSWEHAFNLAKEMACNIHKRRISE